MAVSAVACVNQACAEVAASTVSGDSERHVSSCDLTFARNKSYSVRHLLGLELLSRWYETFSCYDCSEIRVRPRHSALDTRP